METKEKTTRSHQDTDKKHSGRFVPFTYLNTYATDTSTKFIERNTILYTFVASYKIHRNNVRWAKCCHCIEGRTSKGSLNHPEEKMITIKDLIAQEEIETEADLLNYMKKTLPRNKEGEILLPQINMKHPTAIQVRPEIDILRERLAKVEAENCSLKVAMEVMKQQADVDSQMCFSLNEKISRLEEKLDSAERDK